MNKRVRTKREEGQSLIIVGALLIVLVALVGLVVDAGNAYAQRRIVQNATDAAAIAGAQMLGHQDDYKTGGPFLLNYQVIEAVWDYAERNGVSPDEVDIFYTDINGNVLANAEFDLGWQAVINDQTFGGVKPEGIRVEANRPFDTYLVRVIGRNEMTASAKAQGILACGACSATGLFPIAVDVGTFADNGGLPAIGQEYRIWGDKTGPGSFGYLSWNFDPGHTSEQTLVANMADTSRSGYWSVGDNIPCGPGVQNSSSVKTELKYRIDNRIDLNPPRHREVILPIFDYTTGQGANLTYHVVGFARFELKCYHFANNSNGWYGSCTFDQGDTSKWISGVFKSWVESGGESGCTNYGVCTAKLRPPLEEKRILMGSVVPWRVFVQKDAVPGPPQPVDLVHVLDISGSMCYHWNGTPHRNVPCTDGERIQVAKDVLTAFNNALENADWDPNDQIQVGLATFPKMQSTSTYNTQCYNDIRAMGGPCNSTPDSDCGKSTSTLFFAKKNKNLTTNIASVNSAINALQAIGGTSIPLGLQYGGEMIVDPQYHNPNNLQVLILTTDGMANIKINGYWSGYIGLYTRPYWIVQSGCNNDVYNAAIEQADLIKQQGVIIFTIGIHETIDTDLMTAIASPDTDPTKPHFFQARTADDFQAIYESIVQRLPGLGNEECIANENATQGNLAVVRLYDSGGNLVATTTADSSGGYLFDLTALNLGPGTYELRAVWLDHSFEPPVEYDVMTWALGGPPAAEPITVEIPQGTGTTLKDLYLRTDQQFTCGN